jgi:hypothetical protein
VTFALSLASCVQAVDWAYDTTAAPPEGWSLLDTVKAGHVEAVLAKVSGLRVLLLPDTNDILDGVRRPKPSDVGIRAELVDGYRVHGGAWRYAQTLMGTRVGGEGDVLIGYSLGADVALLMGWRMGKFPLAVAPFGLFSPFAPKMAALSLVDPSDWVPHSPSEEWLRPGATLTLPRSGLPPCEAHRCCNYVKQLGLLGALDLRSAVAGDAHA